MYFFGKHGLGTKKPVRPEYPSPEYNCYKKSSTWLKSALTWILPRFSAELILIKG
jgi:hypothetical protein